MSIYILNGFTCNARIPRSWNSGTVELLVETDQGLVLIDTGLGTEDYIHRPGILKMFQVITIVPLDPDQAVIRQLPGLGFKPEDVRDIILTHMHFDHCGWMPDFPHAKVHVYKREYEAYLHPHIFTDLAYVPRHTAHHPDFALYEDTGEKWFDFNAIRLPFKPEMWLLPLPGHSRGICGVAIKTDTGWLFQSSDASALFNENAPAWLIRLFMGPDNDRIRRFGQAHPEIEILNGHMWLSFFEKRKIIPSGAMVSRRV